MVLIEFAMAGDDFEIGEAVNNLTSIKYDPIIAHPERYESIQDMNDYKILKRMGAYIQINAGSILGVYGRRAKKISWHLLKAGLVDFIASDVHDFRKNHLKDAYDLIVKKFSPERAEELSNNKIILKNT